MPFGFPPISYATINNKEVKKITKERGYVANILRILILKKYYLMIKNLLLLLLIMMKNKDDMSIVTSFII
jgi:uncharacterized membrane protein YidH (DUF202 family)